MGDAIKKESLFYQSADGIDKIHASIWTPEGEPRAILQIIHGMQEYIDRYDELARFFAGHGFVVCGEDHLGHGESVADGGTYGYFCKNDPEKVLPEDSHQLTLMMKERYKGLKYVVLGHSFGSFITREYLARFGSDVDVAIISGTAYQPASVAKSGLFVARLQKLFFGDRHIARSLDKISFGSYLSKIENPKTPSDWLSYNEESVAAYRSDPWCTFTFTINGFETMAKLLLLVGNKNRMQFIPHDLPILLSAGREDPVGNYGKGVEQLYNIYKDEIGLNVSLKLYDHMRHEIHNEPDRLKVYEDYLEFVNRFI